MPYFQAMVERANETFNRTRMRAINPALFAEGEDFVDALSAIGVVTTDQERDFLRKLEKGDLEQIRQAIHSALTANPPYPVQFLWMKAGHVDVHAQHTPGTADSIGGASVLIKTPLPSEL
jgi:hypothetical protein